MSDLMQIVEVLVTDMFWMWEEYGQVPFVYPLCSF